MPCMSNSRPNDPLIVASGGIEHPADGDPLEALFALMDLVGDLCPNLPDKPIYQGTVYLL